MPERKGGGPKPRKAAPARARKAAPAARPAAAARKAAAALPEAASGVAPAAAPVPPAGATEATRAGRAGAARRARPSGGRAITIVQVRSGIQAPLRHKRILRSLGLRHPHHTVVRPDNPAVRGMVEAIPHLARIVERRDDA